jgi:AcrR family transcriptional regulator
VSAHSNDPPRVPRAERRQPFDPGRRAEILKAALAVFASKGFHRSTTRDIAKAAGLAEGTIYNHFRNKEELLLAALEAITAGARQTAGEASEEDLSTFLRRHLRERLDDFDAGPEGAFAVILAELLTNAQLREAYARELITPNLAPVEAAFRQRAAAGELKDSNLDLAARAVPALFLGLTVLRLLGDTTLAGRWSELPDAVTDLLLNGMAVERGR